MSDTWKKLALDMLKELNYECPRTGDAFDEGNKRVEQFEARADELLSGLRPVPVRRIEYEMFRRGITRQRLSELTELNRATVSRIISGKQSPGKKPSQAAERIAEILGWEGPFDALLEEITLDDLGGGR